MDPATDTSATVFKTFFHKQFPKEKVQRISIDSSDSQPLKCFDSFTKKEKTTAKFDKQQYLTFESFVEKAAKLYEFVRNFSTLDDSIPTELTEILESQDKVLDKLKEYVDTEKQKVDQQFKNMADEFIELCEKKKKELHGALDEQFTNMKNNYGYYKSKLDNYFGKDSKEEKNPTKEKIIESINESKDFDQLEAVVKKIKDDMSEIEMYGKDPEIRSKEIRSALKEYSNIVKENSEKFPLSVCSNQDKVNDLKKKFDELSSKLFEFALEIDNPIDLLSLSGAGKIGSVIITKPDEIKLLRGWIAQGLMKFKLLYRGSQDGFKGQDFHKKADDHQPTITIIKSHNGKVFGGYSDQTWNVTNNYKNSTNTWIFSMDAKEKYVQKSGQAHYAVYCNTNYGPTFGGGHDIYIANTCNQGTPCYSNYGYTYETKNNSTYGSVQAQSHLAGSYNFRVEEIEVFHVEHKALGSK